MEILGIGAPELIFVIIIALIVLGPKDMQKAGRTIGRWLNQLVRSDGWKAFQQTSREIRNLPTNLMREANLELLETERELRKATDLRAALPPSSPNPPGGPNQTQESENSIQPPSPNKDAQASVSPHSDNLGSSQTQEAENSTQREPPSANSDHALDIGERRTNDSAGRKPDVNTPDQDA